MKLKKHFLKEDYEYLGTIEDKIKRYGAKDGLGYLAKDGSRFHEKMKQAGIGRTSLITGNFVGDSNRAGKLLIKNANSILDTVNKRATERIDYYLGEINRIAPTLRNGERQIFELNYQNIRGERVHDNFGIEKRNGQLLYFHMDDSNPEVGPQPAYDSPQNILYGINGNGILARAARGMAKQELGIGEELYSLKDSEGNKIVVTDPREEVDADGKVDRTFDRGFTNLNIYRLTKSGDKSLLDKEEFNSLINNSGATPDEVNNRHVRRGNFGGTLRTALMVKREIDRAVQEGMDMTTSTRS